MAFSKLLSLLIISSTLFAQTSFAITWPTTPPGETTGGKIGDWVNTIKDIVYPSNGNVGIGTTTPAEALEVSGNILASTNLMISNENNKISYLLYDFFEAENIDVGGSSAGETMGEMSANDSSRSNDNDVVYNFGAVARKNVKVLFRGFNRGMAGEEIFISQDGSLTDITSVCNYSTAVKWTDCGTYDLSQGDTFMRFDDNDVDGGDYWIIDAFLLTDDILFTEPTNDVSGDFTFADDNTNVGIAAENDKIGLLGSVDVLDDLRVNGNVGIGTTDPGAKLDVKVDNATVFDATSTESSVSIKNNSQTDNSFVNLSFWPVSTSTGTGFSSIAGIATGGAKGELAFITRNNDESIGERMRIDHNGNVGIGTTDPGAKLHVQKTEGSLLLTNQNATNDDMTPIMSLDFRQTGHLTESGGSIKGLVSNGGAATPVRGALLFQTSQGGVLTDTMFLDEDGNVGIGTTDPGEELEVNGSVKINDYLQFSSSETNDGAGWQIDSSLASFHTRYYFTAGAISSETEAITDGTIGQIIIISHRDSDESAILY